MSVAGAGAHAGSIQSLLFTTVRINSPATVTVPSGATVVADVLNLSNPAQSIIPILIRCADGQSFTADLSTGQNYGQNRRMKSGANYIDYEVFADAAFTAAWSPKTLIGAGLAVDVTVPLYIHVPAQPSAPPGLYSDTLSISIRY
jgi:spore coat protein U-like protein